MCTIRGNKLLLILILKDYVVVGFKSSSKCSFNHLLSLVIVIRQVYVKERFQCIHPIVVYRSVFLSFDRSMLLL